MWLPLGLSESWLQGSAETCASSTSRSALGAVFKGFPNSTSYMQVTFQ